ncbi:hypothetical protein AAA799E16_01432 [Marine Group I thaumarchaeote SCGC AAA799-E16]|uniref:PepSY domain-containing protein n=4 Tax=Marine Group I TaxID=905826 RepID=A0A081RNT6_9ARCH|nr:hypothetical protein AAA799N04_00693 [Marine Group I thaumarchaeote SCGC AAA799-N04]KER05866.1 hypothetical protein AAA799E16_01432 [Marine Group I thaumarchaeote SCGC AAA799-E16]KFM16251.1 hypothetical protein AAA799D11_00734 [Marine Group I thaumarchaeote SCGC AAA799-D11]KFM16460.1 hypothetical protein SCCGRSA3_02244 [Marine Group I thaumarchaeote SCGC RSA3]
MKMEIFWFQIGFGLFIILILMVLSIKFSKDKISINDEQALKIVRDELEQDGYYNFELESVISLEEPKITTVVIRVGHQEIGLEIDKNTGKIISKEKIAR